MSISILLTELPTSRALEVGMVSLFEAGGERGGDNGSRNNTGLARGGDAGGGKIFADGIDATVAWIADGFIGGDRTLDTTSGNRGAGGTDAASTGSGRGAGGRGGLTKALIEIAAAGLAGKAAAVGWGGTAGSEGADSATGGRGAGST